MLYLLRSLEELIGQQLIEAKRNIVFGQAASVKIDRVRGEILIISAYPNGAEIVFDLAVVL